MQAYVIRRLLIMIPTFFGISLVIFAVLNFAPGRPGAVQSADLSQNARSEQSQESFRIFREQFNLDKPVLLNTRFLLRTDEVLSAVRVAGGESNAGSAEKIRAQEELEDLGGYAVPHLVRIMNDADKSGDRDVRDAAVYFLRLDAPRPLEHPFARNPSEAEKARNREISAENAELRRMRYALDAPEDEKRVVIDEYNRWFVSRAARYEHGVVADLRILFFDTRFAKYWANLARLDFGVSLVSREPVTRTLVGKLRYSLSL